MYRRILVGYDGSPGGKRALEAGIGLARCLGADVTVLAVNEAIPAFAETVGEFEEEKATSDLALQALLDGAATKAAEAGVPMKSMLRAGHPARTIIDVANTGSYDLVVLGHSGLSQAWAMFLGTTAEKVSRHVDCSVLIVR